MGQDHDHVGTIRHEKPLWWALALTAAFLVAELIGAWLTNSLALLSDAAHMATDTLALGIALAAVRFGRRPADAKRTFGYARLEAIGALVNGGLLFLVAGYILWEAVLRFRQPPEVHSTGLLIIASIGLVVNLIAMRLLKAGSGESLNMKGAYLEVWSDMLGSVAVILGAAVMWFTGWHWVDPVLALLIGLWVLPRTVGLVREAGHVLLEGVPRGLDLDALRAAMQSEPGVASVHDLHVWSLSSHQPALAAHVVLAAGADNPMDVRRRLAHRLGEDFGLHHATLQMEASACGGTACDVAPTSPRGPADEAGHGHEHEHDHERHP